ncbi:MAG: Gfo/Idh/MocA family oxidoreductase, partial [Chloroflexia bacterium]|nr:Gfo/Idh/MocA family oxidoreductase [Chloroflexia bacterium]
LHAEHALPFLKRGLPVFIDKPLAISLEDCGQLIATANANGAFLTSFSSMRVDASTVRRSPPRQPGSARSGPRKLADHATSRASTKAHFSMPPTRSRLPCSSLATMSARSVRPGRANR